MFQRLPYLLISRGNDDPTYLTRSRLRDLVKQEVDSFLAMEVPQGSATPSPVQLYQRVIDPKTLEKLPGQLDTSKGLKHLVDHSPARWRSEQVSAVRPAGPREWAFQAMQRPSGPVFYQIGSWVLRQGRPGEEFYITVAGSANERRDVGGGWFDLRTGRETLAPDYAAMLEHYRKSPDGSAAGTGVGFNRAVRALLAGEGDGGPASVAATTAAVFLAEARRMPLLFAANAMFLDLVDRKLLSWDQLTEAHPTARGGGIGRGKEEANELLADLVMTWLTGMSLTNQFEIEGYGHRPDDVADAGTEKQVASLIDSRLTSSADGLEIQQETYHLETTTTTTSEE